MKPMHTEAIMQHLASMCEVPAHIEVRSAAEIRPGVVFVVFVFDGTEQAAVYYTGTDMLFTPRDWHGQRPKTPGEIELYDWVDSAGDEAIVVDGLPVTFNAYRHEFRKEFGQRVAAARCDRGMTQTELGRRAGILRNNIPRIECGRYGVTLDTIARLAAVLGDIWQPQLCRKA